VNDVMGTGILPHGMGAIPSPPDPRDFQLPDLAELTGVDLSVVLPGTGLASGMPAVLDQGTTPQCVAFSSSTMKAWQDFRDLSKYFNFDEGYFFRLIGGNQYGAALRNAMDRLLGYGYPVVTAGQASLHRIHSYYAVDRTAYAIKQAIHAYGPIILGLHWYNSWFYPYSSGVLRSPDYYFANHAITAYGWDDSKGLRLRNSWGSDYGVNGDVFLPYGYLSACFEAWKTIDVLTAPAEPVVAIVKTYSPIRGALIRGGATVYGYDPNRPGGPVKKFVAGPDGSGFRVKDKRTVSYSDGVDRVPHGTFIRGDPTEGGVFAGYLVVPSAVSAEDHLAW
jgi:hypothetical protein